MVKLLLIMNVSRIFIAFPVIPRLCFKNLTSELLANM